MKHAIRRLMVRYPDVTRPIWRVLFPVIYRPALYRGEEYADRESAFGTIFRENRWQSGESVSGSGSTVEATSMLTTALPALLARYDANILLDAPCGDFNWMRHVRMPGVRYIGGDIVPEMIESLRQAYQTEDRRFETLDFVDDTLPQADVWLCRHVFFHLSESDIFKALSNFARSNIRYILIDNVDFISTGPDIRSGGFRRVNLRSAPFNLPRPLARLPNSLPPQAPEYLNLWSREQIVHALGQS